MLVISFSLRLMFVICMLLCIQADEEKSSMNFLGIKQSLVKPQVFHGETPVHIHRVNGHLLSMKGLLPIPGSGSLSFSEGLLDHPSLFNISLLMILVFIAVISVLSGTAGLIILANSPQMGSSGVLLKPSHRTPIVSDIGVPPEGTVHPGCVRILLRDTKHTTSDSKPPEASVECRE